MDNVLAYKILNMARDVKSHYPDTVELMFKQGSLSEILTHIPKGTYAEWMDNMMGVKGKSYAKGAITIGGTRQALLYYADLEFLLFLYFVLINRDEDKMKQYVDTLKTKVEEYDAYPASSKQGTVKSSISSAYLSYFYTLVNHNKLVEENKESYKILINILLEHLGIPSIFIRTTVKKT